MTVTEIPFALVLERDTGRTLGEHMSDVVRTIAVQAGFLPEDDSLPDWERMALGIAWEAFIVKYHPEVLWQPGEFIVDGLPMTPDGISYEGELPVIHEFKLTWKSQGKLPIQSHWMWMSQIMCYCKAVGAVSAVLHVYWVNGDYRFSSGNQRRYYCYRLEFEQEEIDNMWAMIQRARSKA